MNHMCISSSAVFSKSRKILAKAAMCRILPGAYLKLPFNLGGQYYARSQEQQHRGHATSDVRGLARGTPPTSLRGTASACCCSPQVLLSRAAEIASARAMRLSKCRQNTPPVEFICSPHGAIHQVSGSVDEKQAKWCKS